MTTMTNKEAAKILRDVCRLTLPTVNGYPFPMIQDALIMGAEALYPTPVRNCAGCAHRKAQRTENGTIFGCSRWECEFSPLSVVIDQEKDDINSLIAEDRMLDRDDDTLKRGGEV